MNSRLLKGIRVSEGYTQKPVADALGINVGTYCEKENGKRDFTPGEIEKLAAFLNINLYKVNEVFFDKKLTNRTKGELSTTQETA
jgi:transcriptional regulator with XRE-family HTH domain